VWVCGCVCVCVCVCGLRTHLENVQGVEEQFHVFLTLVLDGGQ
jgi:hypothetical protein